LRSAASFSIAVHRLTNFSFALSSASAAWTPVLRHRFTTAKQQVAQLRFERCLTSIGKRESGIGNRFGQQLSHFGEFLPDLIQRARGVGQSKAHASGSILQPVRAMQRG
jgi:hypothetical protein